MSPLQPRSGHLGLILPLCTSSATLGLSLFQYPLFLSFLSPKKTNDKPHRISGTPLSAFWFSFLTPAATLISALTLTSAGAGFLASRWLNTHKTLETTEVGKWYLIGAGLSLGHIAFVPMVAGPIKRMVEGGRVGDSGKEVNEKEVEGRNEKEMMTWLFVHTLRTLVVDVPALWCFAEGVALSFWVI